MEISTNVNTHKLLIKDGREIHVPDTVAKTVRMLKEDGGNKWLSLEDNDGNLLYEGELYQIKEIKKNTTKNYSTMRYICDYGTRHTMRENCNCDKKFGSYIKIHNYLKEKGYNIMYPSNITKQMQEEYLNNLKENEKTY